MYQFLELAGRIQADIKFQWAGLVCVRIIDYSCWKLLTKQIQDEAQQQWQPPQQPPRSMYLIIIICVGTSFSYGGICFCTFFRNTLQDFYLAKWNMGLEPVSQLRNLQLHLCCWMWAEKSWRRLRRCFGHWQTCSSATATVATTDSCNDNRRHGNNNITQSSSCFYMTFGTDPGQVLQ